VAVVKRAALKKPSTIRAMKIPRQLLTALLFASTTVHAEWVEVERFDDGTRAYVDAALAPRDGETAQLTHLIRWGEPQKDEGLPPYLSTRVRTAYDCVAKREKYLGSDSFAGALGDGKRVVGDDNEAEGWDSISEGSLEEKLWKVACAAQPTR
jgi:hypothetical protein